MIYFLFKVLMIVKIWPTQVNILPIGERQTAKLEFKLNARNYSMAPMIPTDVQNYIYFFPFSFVCDAKTKSDFLLSRNTNSLCF